MDFEERINDTLKKYPTKQSALLPILYILQDKYGSINDEAMEEAAKITETSTAYVYGVFSFYTFYKREDEGKYRIWVCSTLPCKLRGSDRLYDSLKCKLGLNGTNTTADGLFSLKKAECLGACEQAPVVQFEDEYLHKTDPDKIMEIVQKIKTDEE